MAFYFIEHSSIPLKASVDAPSTEKARTEYLDYLERNSIIPRSKRQLVRRGLILKRMKSSDEISTDVVLSYGYSDARLKV